MRRQNQAQNLTTHSVATKSQVLWRRRTWVWGNQRGQGQRGWSGANQGGGRREADCGPPAQGCHGWWFRLCTAQEHLVWRC